MIKIYVLNKPLFIVTEVKGEVEDYLHRPDTIFIDEINAAAIHTIFQQLADPDVYAGVILFPKEEEVMKAIKSHLTLIVAAGGLVHTPDNYLLLIHRKGKWDLPKGKLDKGEDLATCALREIEEETGAKGLTIEEPLYISYHTYQEKGKHILKESHWYLIHSATKMPLQPQIEEDIESCQWVSSTVLENYMSNAHASIREVIDKGLKKLVAPV